MSFSNFVKEQRVDETLNQSYSQMAKVNEEIVGPQKDSLHPWFEFHMEQLYHLEKDQQMGVEWGGGVWTQLLVPWPHYHEIVWLAHEMPFAGDLHKEKTQDQIMACLYWLGMYKAVTDFYASHLEDT